MKRVIIFSIFFSFLCLSFCKSDDKAPNEPEQVDQNEYYKTLAPLPEPPEGYEWQYQVLYSDDFEGDELNTTKWRDYHPYWNGRPPAKFMPEAISVKDGTLQLKCGVLEQPDGDFTMQGGAVTSRSENAGFGYYEAKFKATKISMSSTFWLTSHEPGNLFPHVNRELDIVETIGGAKRWPSFATKMKSNTHIRLVTTDGNSDIKSVGGETDLDRPSWDGFHTYGAWWVDENTIHFYYNGEYRYTIHPDTTLVAKPMKPSLFMCLVSETYDWEIPPTGMDLKNDEINTTYYEWVRAFSLKEVE